jgi:hypothetical protein
MASYTASPLSISLPWYPTWCRATPEAVRVDMPLVAVFDDVTLKGTLEKFKPA